MSFSEDEKRELFSLVRSQVSRISEIEKNVEYISIGLYGSNRNDVPGVIERLKKLERFRLFIIRWIWLIQGGAVTGTYLLSKFSE